MSLNFEEVNILGQLMNDTFGKSSTGMGKYKNDASGAGVAIKASLSGNILILMAMAVKNLGTHGQQHHEITNCENELNQYINFYIKDLKSNFKNESGRALKCKQVKGSEITDVESINHYSPTRPSYIRRYIHFEIE